MLVERIVFHILYGKESEMMIAMLWCQQIICGKKTYQQVPRLLKEQVKELLIDSGCEELTED